LFSSAALASLSAHIMTREAGQCGSSAYGIVVAPPSEFAKSPRPDPRTMAIAGSSGTRARMASAASLTWS